MKRALAIILVVACSMFLGGTAFCGPNMQDGLWEITTKSEMKGMPAGMMKPMTHTTCLTQKNSVPEQPRKTDCKMSHTNEGNTVSWTMTCPDSISKGRITYAGTTFEGTMETTMNHDGEKMQVKNSMKGKRIGPCK